MKRHFFPALSLALTAWGLSGPVLGAPVDPPASVQIGEVTVVSGGVNADETRAIRQIAGDYPVRLEISGRGGAFYVADTLSVLQNGQRVVDVPDAGPLVLMDLAPGRYQLLATFDGTTVTRDLQVGRPGGTLHWVIPASID